MLGVIKNTIRNLHVNWLRFNANRHIDEIITANPLILAPHPDDEVFGCGGLISRLISNGVTPYVVIMTGGGASHATCCGLPEEKLIQHRRQLTLNAAQILGLPENHVHFLDFKDGDILSKPIDEINRLKDLITEIKPSDIFIPHWGEGWRDHLAVAEIGKSLASAGCNIYEYCVWMWYYNVWKGLDWKNARVLKMSDAEHQTKLTAIDAYVKPLAPCGKPWSGILPKVFIDAHKNNLELYFKIK